MNLEDIAIGAAIAYTRGEITFESYQRTMAGLMLLAQGVDKPTIAMIDERISEMETALSFISAAPVPE